MGHDFYKPTPFKKPSHEVTTQNEAMSFLVPNPTPHWVMTCVGAQHPVGLGTQQHPTPRWAMARSSLTILEYSHKLNPTHTGKVCEY
jgi:hypothetical protein